MMVNFTILLNAKLLKSTMHTGVGGRGRRGWGVGWGGIKQYSAQHLFMCACEWTIFSMV